jgi:hypothetical protein
MLGKWGYQRHKGLGGMVYSKKILSIIIDMLIKLRL